MEKKFSTQTEKELNWLKNEIEKDKIELEREKKEFINSIKNAKKEDIIQKEDKLTLWKRIKQVLTGY
jgi:hypothetical protein